MIPLEGFDQRRLRAIQNQFAEALIKDDRTDSRKLHSEHIPNYHTEEGYTEMLPTYRSLDLEQLIQQAINQSPDHSMTLVDCGCGKRGAFLRSCEEYWRGYGRIFGIGITARKVLTNEEEQFLASRDISIVKGNIHHVDEVLGENAADIIVSNFSLPYLADPWCAISAINRSLRCTG